MQTAPALSVILPALDESRRLPPYLQAVREYLDRDFGLTYEVIVVDDGSRDATAGVVADLVEHWPQLRLLRHRQNRGKGAAVRTGVLAAGGDMMLFADADGAAPIDQCARLMAAIDVDARPASRSGPQASAPRPADVAIGSRLLPDAEVRRTRLFFRGLAGRLFAAAARRLLGISVRDPQCGFKMFRAEAARKLFTSMREDRYLFDLELLLLARDFHLKVVEVPIRWHEVRGGKMRPLRELPQIVAGLWRLTRR